MNRKEALLAGSTRYRLDTPCKYGHYADRMTSTYSCVECSRTRQRNGRGSPKAKKNSAEPWTAPVPKYLIDINPERCRSGERLATAYCDDKPLFAMVVKSHSAEQVAGRMVEAGCEDGEVVIRYADLVGQPKRLFQIAGVVKPARTALQEFGDAFVYPLAAAIRKRDRELGL